MSLLSKIFNSVWCIDPNYAQSILPQVFQLVEGHDVDFGQIDVKISAVNRDHLTVKGFHDNDESDGEASTANMDQKVVAVVPIRGVIMKDDQFCGPRGMETMNSRVKRLSKDDNVGAIIFDFDSPGGQASFLSTFSETIKSIKKPTLSYYNSLCCSAAYFLASNTDEIYASEKTDIVGSIGTMLTTMNVKGFFEKQGIDIFEVYADQSSEKNGKIKALFNNKDEKPIKEGILNPFADEFISTVKSNRAITDSIVFQGGTFMSEEAMEKGLIDGVKSFDQVIDRAFEMISQEDNSNSSNNNSNTNNMKKLVTIAALLNIQTVIQSQDGQVSLSEENMESIEDALVQGAADTASLATQADELATSNARITALEAELATANTDLTAANEKVTELGADAGAEAATIKPNANEFADGEDGTEPWNDENSAHNVEADEFLG